MFYQYICKKMKKVAQVAQLRAAFECILIKHVEIEDSNRFLIKHGEIEDSGVW